MIILQESKSMDNIIMIHIFNPLSAFVVLNEESMWRNISVFEDRAIKSWINSVNKISYYFDLFKLDKTAKIYLETNNEEVMLQRSILEKWAKDTGIIGSILDVIETHVSKISQVALKMQLEKKVMEGTFVPDLENEISYISPYGNLYPDAYICLYMRLIGIIQEVKSPETPIISNHHPLDKPEDLALEADKTVWTEIISEPK